MERKIIVDPETLQELFSPNDLGLTLREAASITKISHETLRQQAQEHNIPLPHKVGRPRISPPLDVVRKLAEEYSSHPGYDLEDMARKHPDILERGSQLSKWFRLLPEDERPKIHHGNGRN